MRAWLIPFVVTLGLATAGRSAEHLTLYAGESKVLDLEDARRLVTGNPGLLEARSLDEHQILLNARQTGQTSLLVWDRLGQKKAFEVEILSSGLKRAMIEIDVQVLEIGDGVKWDVGLDWAGTLQGQAASTFPASAVSVLEVSPPLLSFGTFQRGPIGARLDALIQDNKARLMAKPRLVTVSGGKARFLSGGQVPVALSDDKGRPSTQYKDYGVSLDIQPTADDEGNVNAQVRAEMSDIDPANSVTVNGGTLPAVKTRWVETNVFVKKNSTLVLAGLLQQQDGTVTQGVPLLSQIPLLGELFKHHSVVHKTSELVIFLTPQVLQ